jgi:diguanylate cyclase (GGDEF)-like protein/putative nucleotidyltransferase with HDIG domain
MATNRFNDLSLGTRVYVAIIVAAGAATVLQSLLELYYNPIGWNWLILAALTLVSGSATVRLPGLPATFSVSETFVFTSVILFGPAVGTLTVALDALVISLWSYHRKGQPLYKSLFNVCALPLTLWLAALISLELAGFEPLIQSKEPIRINQFIWPLLGFTIAYFSLNSWIIAFAIALEMRLAPFKIWRENFVWLSLNYVGGASVAILLVTYTRNLDFTYLALIAPLLVVMYFTFSMSMGRVEDANRHLSQLNSLYMSTIETLAMAIDAKDQITHGHIRRVQSYAIGLARKMGVTDPGLIRAVEAAALLHDMGKLAVPEYILNKPGPLTPAEFEKMKLHASVGADILSAIDFPYPVVPIVRHHHENWDGSGYPDGLSGADIPIGARILSVVDCFDALTSDRPYRPRLADRDAIKILIDRRGSMYDPLVIDIFVEVHDQLVPVPVAVADGLPLRAITEASVSTSTAASLSVSPFDDISGSTEEMLTLFDLARGLSSQMTVQDIGDVISKHLRRLVPSSLCVFFLYDIDNDELFAAHVAGENSALVSGLRIGLGQRLSGWVAANRQTIRNSDPVLDFGESARAMTPRLRSCLSTPLIIGKNLIGVLSLYSTSKDGFSEEHQRVTEVVARQVSPVLVQAADSERAKVTSRRDTLTGLPNVEHLREVTGAVMVGTQLQEPVALILIDVDDLDKINQAHGRQMGDEVLGRVVRATRRSLRAADFLFRYGSDEFVALLLQTDTSTASAIAARIVEAVSKERGPEAGSQFSVSVAVVSAPADGVSVDDLLESANRNLTTKQSKLGRNPQVPPPESIH